MGHLKNVLLIFSIAVSSFVGCEAETESSNVVTKEYQNMLVGQTNKISGCGGFSETHATKSRLDTDYCESEKLYWEYNTETNTLELTNTRVLLNCCGERSIDIELVDGVYIVTEMDSPEEDHDRCRCKCPCDFKITAHNIPEGVIPVRIMSHITDKGDPEMVWQGDLELSREAGSVVTSDQDASTWCKSETQELPSD